MAVPEVHFVCAIEATRPFIHMARLLAYSIRHRAGALADSRITIVFNDRDDDGATKAFLRKRLDTDCITLPRVSHKLHYLNKYTALRVPRLEDSDWIIQFDADVACINPLDELAKQLAMNAFDFAGVPVGSLPIWGIEQVFLKYTGRTKEELDAQRHDWFPQKYPYFNGGMLIMSSHAFPRYRDEIVSLGEQLRNDMRMGGGGPIRWIRNTWNKVAAERPWMHRYIIKPFYPRNSGDQVAIPVLMLKHRMRWEVLPHAYNWRFEHSGQGEDDPIRFLHYLGAEFPIDRERLFDGPWIDEYRRSPNPGARALAGLVDDYSGWQSTDLPVVTAERVAASGANTIKTTSAVTPNAPTV